MLENTESQEMYLTTIYALQKKNGMVRSVDVADERGYSKVSVHKSERNARSVGRPNGWGNTRLLGISWVDGKFQDEEKIV